MSSSSGGSKNILGGVVVNWKNLSIIIIIIIIIITLLLLSLSEFSVFASSRHHLCNKTMTRKPTLQQYFRPISTKQHILTAILLQVSYNSEIEQPNHWSEGQ